MGCSVCGENGHNRRSCRGEASRPPSSEVNGKSEPVEEPPTSPEEEILLDEEEPESEGVKIPIGQGLDATIILPVWLDEEERRNAMSSVGLAAYRMAEERLVDPGESAVRTAMGVLRYEFKASVILGNVTFRASGDGQTWIGSGKTRQEALDDLIGKMFPTRLARECFKRATWRMA